MSADYIVTTKVRNTTVAWSATVRLWSPLIYLLNRASLAIDCCIIIKPANKLLENKNDTTSDS